MTQTFPLFRLPLLALLLTLLLPSAALAEDPEVITVQVEGLGADADGALKNAFQRAVQEAVGTLVDSETLVQNEELIMDEVLTYSDALVTGFEIIEKATKDMALGGLFRIKIEARVERKAVAEKLESSGALSSSVSGKDLWAEHLSAVQGVQDGRKLLQKFFDTHPPNYLWVSRVFDDKGRSGKNAQFAQQTDYDAGVSYVAFNIELFVDMEAYFTRYAPKLVSLLNVISGEVVDDSYVHALKPVERGHMLTAITERTIREQVDVSKHPSAILKNRKKDGTDNDIFVGLLVGTDARGTNQRSRLYRLDKNAYASIFESAYQEDGLRLRVSLLDARGHVIKQYEQDNGMGHLFHSTEKSVEFKNGPALEGAVKGGSRLNYRDNFKPSKRDHSVFLAKGSSGEGERGSVSYGAGTYYLSPDLVFGDMKQSSAMTVRHQVSLSVDELKELSSIQLEFLGPEEK